MSAARGIVSMLVAVATFAVMDATMKHLAASYPPLQVSCLRGLASIPFFVAGVFVTKQWRGLLPVRWATHLIRGVLAILMLWTFVFAVRELPLGTAYGIFLCAPLLITGLSAVFLRQRVGYHRWWAVGLGLVGVVIILNPDRNQMITMGGVAAFASAMCYAISVLMLRNLSRTESTLSIGLSFMVIVAIGTGVAGYADWVPILQPHWPWIVVMGGTGALAQYLLIYAFRHVAPVVVAPLEYTSLLWGIGIDWLLWNTVPSSRMLGGATVVIASGLYVLYREHWMARVIPENIKP